MRKKQSDFPAFFLPMLAKLSNEAPKGNEWLFEVKWDGFRALSFLNGNEVHIRSRNNKSFNDKYYTLHRALTALNREAIFDGEIVVVDEAGKPNFGALQDWRSEADGLLRYYIFDILYLDGKLLLDMPLAQRKQLLAATVSPSAVIRISEGFEDGEALFKSIADIQLEGIMAKRKDSVYMPGKRTSDWLKVKTENRQEFVIGGFTKNEGTDKLFSALLIGIYNGSRFNYVASVGTGFDNKSQEALLQKMLPLKIPTCPFATVPDYNKPSRFRPNPPKADVYWIKPQLVAEISYREATADGSLRHPSFKGLRPDKNAKEVRWEIADKPQKTSDVLERAVADESAKTLLNPTEESQTKNVGGHALKFSNLSKIFWPDAGVSKRDMLNYYYQVSEIMLPFLKNRPQTLNRFPNGINGISFYQKDIKNKVPEWIKRFPYHSEADNRDKEFLVVSTVADLLYIVNLGAIEINPWSSTIQAPENPTWCIIDLDPDKNPFNQVIETANITRQLLDSMGVKSYCKTSGSTGLHIYIPLGGKYKYEDSKEFGRAIAKAVHAELPSFTSIERKTADRKGKIYIDFLQNRPQATVAAPYSLRPKPGATVSMPLPWEAVKTGLTIQSFNIKNAIAAIQDYGPIFQPVLGKGINIATALKKLTALNK